MKKRYNAFTDNFDYVGDSSSPQGFIPFGQFDSTQSSEPNNLTEISSSVNQNIPWSFGTNGIRFLRLFSRRIGITGSGTPVNPTATLDITTENTNDTISDNSLVIKNNVGTIQAAINNIGKLSLGYLPSSLRAWLNVNSPNFTNAHLNLRPSTLSQKPDLNIVGNITHTSDQLYVVKATTFENTTYEIDTPIVTHNNNKGFETNNPKVLTTNELGSLLAFNIRPRFQYHNYDDVTITTASLSPTTTIVRAFNNTVSQGSRVFLPITDPLTKWIPGSTTTLKALATSTHTISGTSGLRFYIGFNTTDVLTGITEIIPPSPDVLANDTVNWDIDIKVMVYLNPTTFVLSYRIYSFIRAINNRNGELSVYSSISNLITINGSVVQHLNFGYSPINLNTNSITFFQGNIE